MRPRLKAAENRARLAAMGPCRDPASMRPRLKAAENTVPEVQRGLDIAWLQ